MKLGKLKQDIQEYKVILSFSSSMEAYKRIFTGRYDNIIVTTLKDQLEEQGVQKIISMLERFTDLEHRTVLI